MKKIPKDFLRMLKPYLDAGLLRLIDGGKHAQVVRADGNKRPVPCSPSCHRALLNYKSQLRSFVGPSPQETK